jgi:hypothetical protein
MSGFDHNFVLRRYDSEVFLCLNIGSFLPLSIDRWDPSRATRHEQNASEQ